MAPTTGTIQKIITTHLGLNLTKFGYDVLNYTCVIVLLSFLIEST